MYDVFTGVPVSTPKLDTTALYIPQVPQIPLATQVAYFTGIFCITFVIVRVSLDIAKKIFDLIY